MFRLFYRFGINQEIKFVCDHPEIILYKKQKGNRSTIIAFFVLLMSTIK